MKTNGNRAIWLVYRTDTKARSFLLVKRTLSWKNVMDENFLEINRSFALTSYCNTIGQWNNAFSVLEFSLGENEESMFWCFHPLADKTNNEHLLKPFFKVILKSLYLFLILTQSDELPDCCGGTTVWWDKNSLLALDRTIDTFDSLLIQH